MAKNMFLVVSILFAFYAVLVKSEGTCDEYGVGDVSECGTGFASLYHIDLTEGNIEVEDDGNVNLHKHRRRQVVYPEISFACNGAIRKWIIAAKWEGNSDAYTELQIWRRSSGSVYTKVGSTTIMVGTENDSQLYEYPLETPLAFQEGDILGYFQPEDEDSELNLYLEKLSRITGYRNAANGPQPPTGPFDTSAATDDDHYPLITVVTDPPDCGCGFMSLERMSRLLGNQIDTYRETYEQKQMIMPDIQFNCSGEVVKWIMGGKWNSNRQHYPELQIWRPSGGTTYQRVHTTTISAAAERDDDIYEFIPDPPLPFQPGDILGVFQPSKDNSRCQVDYDDRGSSVYYYILTDTDQVVSPYTTIDTSLDDVETQTALPLVYVEIVMYMASSAVPQTTSSVKLLATVTGLPTVLHSSALASTPALVVQQSTTTPLDMYSTTTSVQTSPTAALSAVIFRSPLDIEDGGGSGDGVSVDSISVGVGVAGAFLVLTIAPVIVIAVLVCLRRRKNELNTTHNVAYLHNSNVSQTNAAISLTSKHGSPNNTPDIATSAFTNPTFFEVGNNSSNSDASDIQITTNLAYFGDYNIYDDADIPTHTNQSYLVNQSGSDIPSIYDYIRVQT